MKVGGASWPNQMTKFLHGLLMSRANTITYYTKCNHFDKAQSRAEYQLESIEEEKNTM